VRLWENILYAGQRFLNGIHVSRLVGVSAEDDERSGQPSTSKMTENGEKIRDLIHEDRRRTIYELADTTGISYGVCQILTENLNTRCIAPSSQQRAHPHITKNHIVCD
jgi:hypothetical protein